MRILVLDDDRTLRAELSSFLALNGHETVQAAELAEARGALRSAGPGSRPPVDLVLADLYLGREKGTDILADAGKVPVVVISGAGGVREAVEALKAGAWDFLEKPVDPDRLLGLLRNLDRGISAERGIAALRDAWLAEHAAFAPGSPFEAALAEAGRVAASPLSVLVTGPSGSGKEVVARWIHYCSPRSGGPVVAVNCAAVPPELAEAAFFGSVRGAYTGADADRRGWFQEADGGTLFLDEIGEIPLPLQAKLLRAAESGELQRVGSTRTEKVSVRLVSATNRDLAAEAAAGRFREDLFWRLAQATIRVPPLAERKADVPLLAAFFLSRARGDGFGSASESFFDESALAWLCSRDWPGNVRELRALVERAAWLSPGPRVGAGDLEALVSSARGASGQGSPSDRASALEPSVPSRGLGPAAESATAAVAGEGPILPLRDAKLHFERAYVTRALAENGWSVSRAAEALDLLPNNLSRKIRELGIALEREER